MTASARWHRGRDAQVPAGDGERAQQQPQRAEAADGRRGSHARPPAAREGRARG